LYAVRRVFQGVFPAAILAAAVATGAAGCGSSPSHAAASATPAAAKTSGSVSGETPDTIVTKAFSALKTAPSLKMSGSVTQSGQDIGLDVTVVKGQGCAGTVSLAGKGSLQIISLNSKLWLQPSDQFYKAYGATAALPQLSGKWLTVAKSSDLASIGKLCTLTDLAGTIKPDQPGLAKATGPVISGQPTVKITQSGENGSMYVSAAATPEVLRLTVPGTGDLEFSGYDAQPAITPPPASATVDGSQFGF
jgi:hypothetical protein